MTVLLQMVCQDVDVDPSTGACAHPMWVAVSGLLPPMDAATGVTIGLAIAAAWASAWMYKFLRRVAE